MTQSLKSRRRWAGPLVWDGKSLERNNEWIIHLQQDDLEEIVVYSRDRLSRFNADIIEDICNHYTTLSVVSTKPQKSDAEELSEDIISIITVFTARYYGKRKYRIN